MCKLVLMLRWTLTYNQCKKKKRQDFLCWVGSSQQGRENPCQSVSEATDAEMATHSSWNCCTHPVPTLSQQAAASHLHRWRKRLRSQTHWICKLLWGIRKLWRRSPMPWCRTGRVTAALPAARLYENTSHFKVHVKQSFINTKLSAIPGQSRILPDPFSFSFPMFSPLSMDSEL